MASSGSQDFNSSSTSSFQKQPTFNTEDQMITFFYPFPRIIKCPLPSCDATLNTDRAKNAITRHLTSHNINEPKEQTFCGYCNIKMPYQLSRHSCQQKRDAEIDAADMEEIDTPTEF